MNIFTPCADTDNSTASGTMPKSEHTCDLMKFVLKDDNSMIFIHLIYNKIDTMANTPEKVIVKMNVHEA